MTAPKSKSENLSQGAKSEIRRIAKEHFYGYTSEITTKPVLKGLQFEQAGIDLLNSVRFGANYVKNKIRLENEYLNGCCDIITDDLIIDIKSPWSLETFPATEDEGFDSLYEWQGRAYMQLYDRPRFELIYTMYSTDNDLLTDWDNRSIHKVDHINPAKRITVLSFDRDQEKEEYMLEKLRYCSEYYSQYMQQLNNK